MAVFTASALSGSTNGRPIPVAATATPGTLLHTANAAGLDEIDAYASNVTASPVLLTIEFGGVTTGDKIQQTIPANSTAQVLFGQRIQAGLAVRAFAATAAAINVTGRVNNITQ